MPKGLILLAQRLIQKMINIHRKVIILALAMLLSVTYACFENEHENIMTQQKAIHIAENAFEKQYGSDYDLKIVQPYQIHDKVDYWLIEGKLPEDMLGGVPVIKIRKSDGAILEIYHTK